MTVMLPVSSVQSGAARITAGDRFASWRRTRASSAHRVGVRAETAESVTIEEPSTAATMPTMAA
jgi:hypothetical protein